MPNPLIYLDRDGTLIEERDYLGDPKQVKLLPRAVAGLKSLDRAGLKWVIISNQSGVGRGLLKRRAVERVNRHFIELLRQRGVRVRGYYWCPHSPADHCPCRKPALGLVKKAARALKHTWRDGISVGDRKSDVELGQRTGGKGILVLTGYGRENRRKGLVGKPDFVAKDFQTAVRWILRRSSK